MQDHKIARPIPPPSMFQKNGAMVDCESPKKKRRKLCATSATAAERGRARRERSERLDLYLRTQRNHQALESSIQAVSGVFKKKGFALK